MTLPTRVPVVLWSSESSRTFLQTNHLVFFQFFFFFWGGGEGDGRIGDAFIPVFVTCHKQQCCMHCVKNENFWPCLSFGDGWGPVLNGQVYGLTGIPCLSKNAHVKRCGRCELWVVWGNRGYLCSEDPTPPRCWMLLARSMRTIWQSEQWAAIWCVLCVSYCVALPLVTRTGSTLTVDEDCDPGLMHFVRCSYGMLGVVYEVTFNISPLRLMKMYHKVRRTAYSSSIEDTDYRVIWN